MNIEVTDRSVVRSGKRVAGWFDGLDDRQRLLLVCLATALIVTVARMPFLLSPGWSVDSYTNWNAEPNSVPLTQGRPVQWALLSLIVGLGFDRNAAAALLQPIGLFGFAFVTPLMFLLFQRPSIAASAGAFLASLVFLLHPYQAEILTFSEASFYAHAASAAAIVAMHLSAKRAHGLWLGIALTVAALGTYQLALNYMAVTALAGLGFLGWKGLLNWREPDGSARQWINVLLCMLLGVVGYYVLAAVSVAALGLQLEQRGTVIGLAALPERAHQFVLLLRSIGELDLIGKAPVARWALGLLLVGGLITALVRARRRPADLLGGVLLLGLMLVAAAGVVLVGTTWWPVPRVLGGYALVAGWIILVLVQGSWGLSPFRGAVFAVATALVLGFAGIGAAIHHDQQMVNRWDTRLASAIYEAAREHVEPGQELEIEIANSHMRWTHAVPVQSLRGDMNMSAFFVRGALPNLFKLSTGRSVRIHEPSLDAIAACEAAKPWPDRAAVERIADNRVRVCL